MTFTTTPTAKTLKIMVSVEDEKKAFEIIDAWLQKSEMFNPEQFHDFKFYYLDRNIWGSGFF